MIERNHELLLVRVRDNEKYYFAGGKIEAGEQPVETLHREVREELGVDLVADSVDYLTTVRGPALDSNETVELNCFSGELNAAPIPCAEITDIGWVAISDTGRLAPAVQLFCNEWFD